MIEPNDLPAPEDLQSVQRALLSVFDKTGLVDFAQRLVDLDIELISTGGTAARLREADLPVTDVADLTGYPEILNGRVKTLHPAIHGGLLARRNASADQEELSEQAIAPIDLVVVNLYPFEKAATQPDASDDQVIENIDIGGPTLLRAAAKNFSFVGAVTSPEEYASVARELEDQGGQLSLATRRRLARAAFSRTARYDQAITTFFERGLSSDADEEITLPDTLDLHLPRAQSLRYGENPHQQGALYGHPDPFFEKLHGKDLSFNNLIDISAALQLIDEFRDAGSTCAILKHTNPCGVATEKDLEAAYQQAFSTDRQSPFGGVVIVNRPLDRATAEAIDQIFTELIIAPSFEEGVLDFLKQKKKRRLIKSRAPARTDKRLDLRYVLGGLLAQVRDPVLPPAPTQRRGFEVVTDRDPTEAEWRDLIFAWRIVKHVKSNAIVYASKQATLGIGAGQMSRIDASELAVRKGHKSDLDFTGSVVASDAFFPFADGLVAAAENGAQAAIQPGGSIRDEEVIKAANTHNMAMVFTGRRHFRH